MPRWLLLGVPLVAVLAAVLLATGRDGDPAEPAATPQPAERSRPIGERGLAEHLRALQRIADENGGNRAAGTPGDRASAAYVQRELREAGYRVTVTEFDVPVFDERAAPRLVAGTRRFEPRTLQFSADGGATGAVRRLGLGCAAGDFAALRRGEIALLERGTCTFLEKATNADRAGAVAVLVADEEPVAGTLGRPAPLPVLAVSDEDAAELAGRRATVEVDAVSETRTTSNVVGEIGPRDPRRVVMAGGHLDSVPAGPGLNDNGSGVAALLGIAEQLSGRRLGDGTAVRLGFWGAEEIGLVGSRRYVDDLPAAERRRIAAYINLDMVGSPDAEPAVYGTPRVASVLRRQLDADARERDLGNASDHAPCADAGIAVGGLFTGLDECYHERCDTIRNVDRDVLTESARGAGAAVQELAR